MKEALSLSKNWYFFLVERYDKRQLTMSAPLIRFAARGLTQLLQHSGEMPYAQLHFVACVGLRA
jgi:hypothetical protein